MRSSILATFLNLVLSILLVIKIGYCGVVVGTALAMIIAASYFILMFHRVMNIPFWATSLKIFLKPFAACCIPFLISYILAGQIERFGWFSLIGTGLLYFVLFAWIILVVNYLDEFDKSLVNKYSSIRLFKIKKTREII